MKMTNAHRAKLLRASTKLEIPLDQLNPVLVNLMFGQTNYKAVYKALSEYLELVQAGKKAGKSRQQMLEWLNS
jgi:hypothetical protein